MPVSTFSDVEENTPKKAGFLSRLFAPISEAIDEYQKLIDRNTRWNDRRQNDEFEFALCTLIDMTEINGEMSDADLLREFKDYDKRLKNDGWNMHQFGKIDASEVIKAYREMSVQDRNEFAAKFDKPAESKNDGLLIA